jgi:N-acetylglutamate synthase-like GNAT family acetyltransferase
MTKKSANIRGFCGKQKRANTQTFMELKYERTIDGFLFSTDKGRIDLLYVHHFLSTKSYWAEGIPLELVRQSIKHSLSLGIYKNNKQVGFARVVTDYATFGYLADVFVDEAYRGKSLSKILMEFIFSLEELKGLRRIMLATRDAHSLYAQYGFKLLQAPERFMEFHQPDVYKKHTSGPLIES